MTGAEGVRSDPAIVRAMEQAMTERLEAAVDTATSFAERWPADAIGTLEPRALAACRVLFTLLPIETPARGHKTDTSETTRATSRDASVVAATARFAGETVSRVIAHVRA